MAPLFSWRGAIADSDLAPTTRHVLLTLSTYMNERGGSAFPGSARLAHDSGLHQDTVKTHLRDAVDRGWLRVVAPGGSLAGGKRLATQYAASVPGADDPWSNADRGSSSADRGSSSVRPGVQNPPISSVSTPVNSGASTRFAGDPNCVQCHGAGEFYGGQHRTIVHGDGTTEQRPFLRRCPCADARPLVAVEIENA